MKVYHGSTLAEALKQVRAELGSDAVILHTRSFQQGGVMGWFARTVHEVTAARGSEIGRASRRRSQERSQRPARRPAREWTERDEPSPLVAARPTKAAAPSRLAELPAGDLIRKTYLAARQEILGGRSSQPGGESPLAKADLTPTTPTAATPSRQPSPSGSSASDQQAARLAEELSLVRRMVSELMQQRSRPMATEGPEMDQSVIQAGACDPLAAQFAELISRQVSEELAREIVEKVRRSLAGDRLADPAAVREAVRNQIATMLPASDDDDPMRWMLQRRPDGRPHVLALVGPTGVGKTTTIAKLAATFRLRHRRSVGLITTDTYRIGAVDQLRTYADIIGVRLEVVSNAGEMSSTLEKLQGLDVVLIDTAGRSQRDDPRLNQLRQLLEAAAPDQVHLVLSSTSCQQVCMEASERFEALGIDRLIFTKLDEAVGLGVLLNVARKVNKQLSFVTTGQAVPHQIEVGQAHRLAELVIEGLHHRAPNVGPSVAEGGNSAAKRASSGAKVLKVSPREVSQEREEVVTATSGVVNSRVLMRSAGS
ncbi:MAG: flagellar biosynthesis protein FlhF [Phycisphaeraceae bacterium]|nr:flagellar biosynthesis protein FlhF [Phycisphaeraceae bacterium]